MILAERAVPVYMIGDSHCLIYADLIFERMGRPYLFRSKYCPALATRVFSDNAGALNPMIVEALAGEGFARTGVLKGDGSALVAFAGWSDLYYFIRKLGGDADFVLDDVPFDPSVFEARPISSVVPAGLARDFAVTLLSPLFRGLQTLAAAGFRTFVHTIVPPTPDNDAFRAVAHFDAALRLRYKAAVFLNALLREFVRQHPEVGLIDTWQQTTNNGMLDPSFHLDHTHLNKQWAALTGELVVERIEGKPERVSGSAPNPAIERAVEIAASDGPARSALIESVRSRLPLADFDAVIHEGIDRVQRDIQVLEAEVKQNEKAAEAASAQLDVQAARFAEARAQVASLEKRAALLLGEIETLSAEAERRLNVLLAIQSSRSP